MTSTPPELEQPSSTPSKGASNPHKAHSTGLSLEEKKKLGKKVGIVAALLGTLAVGIPVMNSLQSNTEKVEPQQETKALSPAPGTLPAEGNPALHATPVAAASGTTAPLPNGMSPENKATPVVKELPPAPPVVNNTPPAPASSKPIMAVESTAPVRQKPVVVAANTATENHAAYPAPTKTASKTAARQEDNTAATPAAKPSSPAKPLVVAQTDPKFFNVQFGLFREHNNAVALMNRLKENGIPAYLETRVQLGPFHSKQEAEATVSRLKEKGVKGVIVPGAN